MLFVTTYTPKPNLGHQDEKRLLQLFAKWTPPEGSEITQHYAFAGGGGVTIGESESAAALLEALAPFSEFFDFQPHPAVEIVEAVGILGKVIAWRDSL